jgi:predicted RNA-binding protein YlxR (DUF448 family)
VGPVTQNDALSGAQIRMCIGCRRRGLRSELTRLALAGQLDSITQANADIVDTLGVVVVDETKSMPGRGAWLHLSSDCLDKAVRRRAFARALRVSDSPNVTAIVSYMTQKAGTEPMGIR